MADARIFADLKADHDRHRKLLAQIAETSGASDDRKTLFGLVAGRQMRRQPVEQSVHGLDRLGFGRLVLLAPARDLARDVTARPAEVGEPQRGVVDGMQARQHIELRFVDRAAAFARELEIAREMGAR